MPHRQAGAGGGGDGGEVTDSVALEHQFLPASVRRARRERVDYFSGLWEQAMIDITTLSREEQLDLIEKLWDSLSSTPEAIPLTDPQREELDRRLNELDREGPVGVSVDEVLGRLHTRRT